VSAATASGDTVREATRPAAATASSGAPGNAGVPAPPADLTDGNHDGQPMELAFTANLSPADTTAEDRPAALPHADSQGPARGAPAAGWQHSAGQDTPDAPDTTAPPAADRTARPADEVARSTPAGSPARPDDEPESGRKTLENGASGPADASHGHLPAGPPGAIDVRPASQTDPAESSATAKPPATAGPPTDPASAAVRPPAAHDIQFQLGGQGDSRVEVRVTERAGDVHVSVSTPDTRLAEELRAELPALASRLEQTGFHAETWHPGAAGERPQPADPPGGAAAQDAQSQSRRNGGGEREPQPQPQRDGENPDDPAQPKEPGKDFAWLLSSIR
jgi:hypothetical protein